MESTTKRLLTLDEAAAILQVHRETVKWYIQEGKLNGVKLGYRTIRIKSEDLTVFIESQRKLSNKEAESCK